MIIIRNKTGRKKCNNCKIELGAFKYLREDRELLVYGAECPECKHLHTIQIPEGIQRMVRIKRMMGEDLIIIEEGI